MGFAAGAGPPTGRDVWKKIKLRAFGLRCRRRSSPTGKTRPPSGITMFLARCTRQCSPSGFLAYVAASMTR
eukprot:9265939-Pyramimonas_sp.AAC.1